MTLTMRRGICITLRSVMKLQGFINTGYRHNGCTKNYTRIIRKNYILLNAKLHSNITNWKMLILTTFCFLNWWISPSVAKWHSLGIIQQSKTIWELLKYMICLYHEMQGWDPILKIWSFLQPFYFQRQQIFSTSYKRHSPDLDSALKMIYESLITLYIIKCNVGFQFCNFKNLFWQPFFQDGGFSPQIAKWHLCPYWI